VRWWMPFSHLPIVRLNLIRDVRRCRYAARPFDELAARHQHFIGIAPSKPERKVLAFVAAQSLERLLISSVTLAEIRFGIELLADANHRRQLSDWLAHQVRPMFEQRILR
jgi:hypothetical protein